MFHARVFDPKIQNVPVAVLSSNDGCIVARSNEVKSMGVKMGAPYFKYETILKKNKVRLYSSNYSLYGDMSQRVMNILAQLVPYIEIYSIDEAFLDFTDLLVDGYEYGHKVRDQIQKLTGIPVSIGIAHTRTLSKLASHIAKHQGGVTDFTKLADSEIDELSGDLAVDEIWGIGRKYSVMLKSYGISTVRDFKNADSSFIQKKMTVGGLRTQYEIRGISTIPFGSKEAVHKSIASTRSFGREVKTIRELKEAISRFTGIAAQKLRRQKSMASFVSVFVSTNRHHKFEKQYSSSIGKKLSLPTASTPLLTKTALSCLEMIFHYGCSYKRAGIILGGIVREADKQFDYFSTQENVQEHKVLMKTIDNLNRRWGSGTLRLASEGLDVDWLPKQTLRSPRYTTRWEELPVVKS